MNSKKLHAWANIGWSVAVHLAKKPFRDPDNGGERQFLANYAPDGILPFPAEFTAMLPDYQKCVQCGLCDAHCPMALKESALIFPGPSNLATAVGRNPAAANHARAYLAKFDECGECRECERVCPEQVPLKTLAAHLSEYAGRMDALLSGNKG